MSRLPVLRKGRLTLTIWGAFWRVHLSLRRAPLPEAVTRIGDAPAAWWGSLPPMRLSRSVHRALRVGGWQPRCLIGSMVLYRLLRAQGTDADLVIGLPDHPQDHEAHAWVEVGGNDVGPPPGRGQHRELARYPA